MSGYSIGQLARAAGIPTSTLRYYERSGLLKPEYRTGGNYRGYGAGSLQRLRFIRSAQATGFSLSDIAELLSLTTDDKPPCAEVTSLLSHRLGEVRKRLRELRHVERTLARSLRDCCKGNDPDICSEVARLQRNSVCRA